MPKAVNKRICCSCGESLPESDFYKSYSDFYYDSRLPICKKCFTRRFFEYSKDYKSSKMAMQRMCMAFDIYFNEKEFDSCDIDDNTVIGNYFRRLNMAQAKGKTFENSISEGAFSLSGDRKKVKGKRVAYVDEYDNVQEEDSDPINPKDIEKWGVGFESFDYDALNSHYKYLKNANPNCDSNQEIFIIDLCYTHMKKMKALRNGDNDDYIKFTESYRKSFNQAGLKTVQDSVSSDDCWSVYVNMIGQYTPEEYYKDKQLYKDWDGFDEYMERHVGRPINNLENGTSVRDKEFYVHEDDEDG